MFKMTSSGSDNTIDAADSGGCSLDSIEQAAGYSVVTVAVDFDDTWFVQSFVLTLMTYKDYDILKTN